MRAEGHLKFLAMALTMSVLTACQSGPSLLPQKDGYFTWVDETGQVRSSPIRAEDRAASRPSRPSESVNGKPDISSSATAASTASPSDQPASTSVAPSSGSAPARSDASDQDSEFNLTNYPDADTLEQSGYIRPGDPLPYYTWRDTDGNFRVSYYRPDTRSDAEKGRVEQPVTLTEASVYRAVAASTIESIQPRALENVPEAYQVLGIDPNGKTLFERWQDQCCETLSVSNVADWSASREFPVEVDDTAPVYRFSTGVSRYRLVRLPAETGARGFVMRVRAFDSHGVFVPSLAFLDKDLKTVRLVTDLVMDFIPENWHRQGYLEAFVPAFPTQGERWLMIFTRAEDLASQTVTETDRGPRRIEHQPKGVLSLTEMQP